MTPRELKPCPFCGSDDVDAKGWLAGDGGEGPQCMNCGATSELEWWNTRAALPEQPLSREWREQADEHDRAANNMGSAMYGGIQAAVLRGCATDLDAQHDEDRELLREAAQELGRLGAHSGSIAGQSCKELSDRIRKHLEDQP